MSTTTADPRLRSALQPVTAGVVGAVTGYASSFTVVLAGLTAVGATPAQAASGLLALCALQGVLAVVLSWQHRVPVSFAWSTPGAAVLVAAGASGGVTFPEAVGAFLLCGALVVLTGAWPALARLVTRVPAPLSGALLAGVLLPLCLAPVGAVVSEPLAGGAVVVVWLVLRRLAPAWAVPAALVVALVLTLTVERGAGGAASAAGGGLSWVPALAWTTPQLDPLVLLGVGLPLYLVTMASQNVPGLAVLRGAGYPDPPARSALVGSGAATVLGAPFGAHAVNLAALSAAIMAGPDSHPDPRRRWPAAVTGGAVYLLVLAPLSAAAASLVSSAPPVLVQAVAGLALLGAFLGGLASAVDAAQPAEHRTAAVLALLVVASGVSVLGIGSAVWGLLAGAVCWAWLRPERGGGVAGLQDHREEAPAAGGRP